MPGIRTGKPVGRPPKWTPKQLKQAQQLLEDGTSYREASRSTGVPRTTLREKTPGKGWTMSEGGQLGAAIVGNNGLHRMQHDIGLLQQNGLE